MRAGACTVRLRSGLCPCISLRALLRTGSLQRRGLFATRRPGWRWGGRCRLRRASVRDCVGIRLCSCCSSGLRWLRWYARLDVQVKECGRNGAAAHRARAVFLLSRAARRRARFFVLLRAVCRRGGAAFLIASPLHEELQGIRLLFAVRRLWMHLYWRRKLHLIRQAQTIRAGGWGVQSEARAPAPWRRLPREGKGKGSTQRRGRTTASHANVRRFSA